MNYLAHLSLSFDDPALMVGNFVADEVRPKDVYDFPPEVALGVYLHREIDEYTDNHPAYIASVARLRSVQSKYASVIVDIVNDHFLSSTWTDVRSDDLDEFIMTCYHNLDQKRSDLHGRALIHVETLLTHRYLRIYTTRDNLCKVMARMDRRTRFPSDFVGAVDHIWADYAFYESRFRDLYLALTDELPAMLDRARLTLKMKRDGKGST